MTQHESIPRSLLFVCLGNICRSPVAEGATRALAAQRDLSIEVDSAGTGPWHTGEPPDRRMQAAARAAGYDLSAQRARQIARSDFDRFDLIVALDEENLAAVERLRPDGNTTPVRLLLPFGTSGRRNVPDPYNEGGFDTVLRMIEAASGALLTRIAEGRTL